MHSLLSSVKRSCCTPCRAASGAASGASYLNPIAPSCWCRNAATEQRRNG